MVLEKIPKIFLHKLCLFLSKILIIKDIHKMPKKNIGINNTSVRQYKSYKIS